EIVHAREEHGADRDPEERRHPPPDHGDGRSDDGRGAGDRREVMTPEDELVRRDVVDAVVEFMGRSAERFVEPVHATTEIAGVEEVSDGEDRQSDEHEQKGGHRETFLSGDVAVALTITVVFWVSAVNAPRVP